MKLQLNESTLNAYINEAIKRELNEAGWDKLAKFGTKAGEVVKGAAKGTKNYVRALGGNKKLVSGVADDMDKILKNPDYKNLFKEFGVDSIDQLPKEVRKNPKKLLQFVKDMQEKNTKVHGDWKAKNGMIFNKDLGAQGDALVRLERDLTKAINGTKLARVGTGLSAAGFGAGYLAGRSRKNGQNPDAPWNDGIADPGMNDGGFDDNGGNDGGFDGTFPWDNTDPAWTPRPTRNPQPQPGQAQVDPAQEEPQQPVRRGMEALQPVSTINMPTGVTSNQPEPTIQRRYAPGTDPNNVNKWNNTANYRRLSGQIERGVSPERAIRTLQNRRERQEKRYDRISDRNSGQANGSAQ